MAKIHIEKSEKTLKKEEMKTKIEALKNKKNNVTNEELKDLLLIVLDKLK